MPKTQSKPRRYDLVLRGGGGISGKLDRPEVLDRLRAAPAGSWEWFNDTEATIWVRPEEIQAIIQYRDSDD